MNILVVGGGGREHALAWKLAQSSRVSRVLVAPGNGGTDLSMRGAGSGHQGKIENLSLGVEDERDFPALIASARKQHADLTVIGPEIPLASGIVDAFQAAGLRCFGPARAAARLESSKAFAKGFMSRHGIPTGRSAVFTDYTAAMRHLADLDYPVVIKASGLAAGKGVIVPSGPDEAQAALREILVDRVFGQAGDEVLLEERLYGPEASLLAFSDGQTVVPMPVAQDHKRLLDGDRGPNTGGMGAYAPAPLVSPEMLPELTRLALQPVVDGMRAEGTPYMGVLYAGLMLTEAGPRVLEYNCRFGDPETQVILPLLESDLVDVLEACLDGRLQSTPIKWRSGSAATVVAASGGYPGTYAKGKEITGTRDAESLDGVTVFHAGTRVSEDGRLLTHGGRVLTVTGTGDNLRQALDRAYAGMGEIGFEGMQFRRDIGAQALS